jgi:hypothetical protein
MTKNVYLTENEECLARERSGFEELSIVSSVSLLPFEGNKSRGRANLRNEVIDRADHLAGLSSSSSDKPSSQALISCMTV